MLHEIFGADFSGDIIMPDHVIRGQVKFYAKPCRQLHERPVSLIRKLPGLIRMADLDGHGIRIALI